MDLARTPPPAARRLGQRPAEQRHGFRKGRIVEQSRLEPVVDVVMVVGDLVDEVDHLRFERRLQVRLVVRELGRDLDVDRRRVLGDSLAHLPGQVQAGKGRVAILEMLDDAQRLPVVVEAAVVDHQAVEDLFTEVPERRVPQVVGQRQRLDQVLVEAQRPRDRAADLADLDGVGQPRAVVVALVVDEDLGLVLEPAEGAAVDDPVAVALEGGAVVVLLFLVTTTA